MFVEAYLATAAHLAEQYPEKIPLPIYLKSFFSQNKKFGSRDRKMITELVYGFFRIPPDNKLSSRARLLAGSFLSGRLPQLFFEKLDTDLSATYSADFEERKRIITNRYGITNKTTFELSSGINEQEYDAYLFNPKPVFLRVRKNSEAITACLKKAQVSFQWLSHTALRIDTKVDLATLLPREEDYVVQDLGTQWVGDNFFPCSEEVWWDCCAASGGKSLMVLDKEDSIQLYASDIRATILENYKQRLLRYGYDVGKRVKALDASGPLPADWPALFDQIICDVPCSGSGTWAQAPEQQYFFSKEKLFQFHTVQKSILRQAIQRIKQGGMVHYITCSVFKHENEEVVEDLAKEMKLELLPPSNVEAHKHGGDFIFYCGLKKL